MQAFRFERAKETLHRCIDAPLKSYRDGAGKLLTNAPLLERIAEDPILRDVKIIAKTWDATGVHEVGSFSERRREGLHDHYRDDVRRF